MNVIYIMIPISLLLAAGFLTAFVWGAHSGQLDDLETPAHRMLEDKEDNRA